MQTTNPLHEQLVEVAHVDSVYLHKCLTAAIDGLEKVSSRISKRKIRKKATSYTRKIWENFRESRQNCRQELADLDMRIEKAWGEKNLAELFTLGSYIYENLGQTLKWMEVLSEV